MVYTFQMTSSLGLESLWIFQLICVVQAILSMYNSKNR